MVKHVVIWKLRELSDGIRLKKEIGFEYHGIGREQVNPVNI